MTETFNRTKARSFARCFGSHDQTHVDLGNPPAPTGRHAFAKYPNHYKTCLRCGRAADDPIHEEQANVGSGGAGR